MWDVASVSFYVKLPLVPPQGLSLAWVLLIYTLHINLHLRQSRLGLNEGGEHIVSKSEFCQEEGGPGIGAGLSLPPILSQAAAALPCLEGAEEKPGFSRNLRWPQQEAGEILGHGTNQNQDKLYRNLSNMIPQQTEDAQHTNIWKTKPTDYLVGLEKSIFEILCQQKQESLSLICDSEASWEKCYPRWGSGTWQDDQHREIGNGERQSQGQDSQGMSATANEFGCFAEVFGCKAKRMEAKVRIRQRVRNWESRHTKSSRRGRTCSPGRRVSLEQTRPHHVRKQWPVSWQRQNPSSPGQPRVHSILVKYQATKSIRDLFFSPPRNVSWARFSFFPKKPLPPSSRHHNRMFFKRHRVNLYHIQHLRTPRGYLTLKYYPTLDLPITPITR